MLAAIAPDYQTQQMQAERRLALSQALQQQAMSDTPGNGGAVSWTQGLARVLDAVASKHAAKQGYADMKSANQGYAAGIWSMFHPGQPYPGAQTGQGAPSQASGTPMPAQPQATPQQSLPTDPNGIPAPNSAISAVAQGQPVAPPQAAPPPPSASPPAPTGGASNPMSLTGDPNRDMTLYMMNPDEYTKQLAGVAAKGATPTDTEVLMNHAHQLAAQGDYQGAAMLQAQAQKAGYIAPISGRPGGWTIFPDGHREYNPQAPAPGAMPVIGPDGKPTGAWTEDPSASDIQAHQAGAVTGAQAAAKTPYQLTQVYNATTGQMETVPVSSITGSNPGQYTPGAGGSAPGSPAGPVAPGGHAPAGPPLGLPQAQGELGKGYAQQFNNEQDLAKQVPAQRQSLYNMWNIVRSGTPVGPSAHKLQELAKDWGITPLANSNLFVFDKNASRFIAQSMQALGVQGSDARMGLIGSASPNSQMDAGALNKVIPEVIGLQNALAAKADAKAYWIQHNPQGVMSSPQFEAWWRQNYDPRIFTMMAFGPAAFKAAINKLPAQARQTYMSKYYAMRDMGVDYSQFAQ